jgi:GLPGLI family protein
MKYKLASFLSVLLLSSSLMAQQKVSECSIVYDITVQTSGQRPTLADMFDGATTTVYLKGNLSRSEMVSSLGKQSTIMDRKSGSVTVLKEYGEQKFLIPMTPAEWKQANKRYDTVKWVNTTETKTIAGYKCEKATGTLTDGTRFDVFFTKELIPENNDFEYAYRGLPGLVMEYETVDRGMTVRNTVSKINFNVVPASKFELPKSGFRIITYAETNGKNKQ